MPTGNLADIKMRPYYTCVGGPNGIPIRVVPLYKLSMRGGGTRKESVYLYDTYGMNSVCVMFQQF